MSDEVPEQRAARAAQLARLAGGEIARNAATKATNLARGPDARRVAVERRHLEAIDRVVRTLGTMRGVAMKIGQMLSMLELGFVAEEDRAPLQRRLDALQDAAPKVAPARMHEVLEAEIGPVAAHFSHLDAVPLAAASIGQVFQGRLRDGREVAVKIQYPGIATVVRADLKNLALVMRLAAPVLPGVDLDALADELRLRITEELDYGLEAANQIGAVRRYAGHPFIHVPEVISELSTERVLVSMFVDGRRAAQLETEPQAVRDRMGEILVRFYLGGAYRFGWFPADPHPGNHLLMDDGRVAFVDFGLVQQMDPVALQLQRNVVAAGLAGNYPLIHALLEGAGIVRDIEPTTLADLMHDVYGWYFDDGEREITPRVASDALLAVFDPRSNRFAELRHQRLPREHLISRRTEVLLLGALGRLRARGNWHRIVQELSGAGPPASPLGDAEAAWLSALR